MYVCMYVYCEKPRKKKKKKKKFGKKKNIKLIIYLFSENPKKKKKKKITLIRHSPNQPHFLRSHRLHALGPPHHQVSREGHHWSDPDPACHQHGDLVILKL